MAEIYRVTSTTVLQRSLDVPARLKHFTTDQKLKGMYHARMLENGRPLGVTLDHVEIKERPRAGRYLPFLDYPQRDFFSLAVEVARARTPDLPLAESLRQLARGDFETLAVSAVGRVALAFVSDARALALRAGELYGAVLKGSTVTAEGTDRGAILRLRRFPGLVDCYPVGTLEGAFRHFDQDCEIEVHLLDPTNADYHVRFV